MSGEWFEDLDKRRCFLVVYLSQCTSYDNMAIIWRNEQ